MPDDLARAAAERQARASRARLRPRRRADRAAAPDRRGRRGFAQARLRALWPDIAGLEFAAICAPLKLARARGPAGGLLTLAVDGPHAPQLQLLLPLLRERVNAALGPGTVGRIQLTHVPRFCRAGGAASSRPPPRRRRTSASRRDDLKHW